MEEFEIRYNAMEQAMLLMIQRLALEVAKSKGDDATTWVDQFRNAVVTEINDTMHGAPGSTTPRPKEITDMAVSVVSSVATMTKARLAEPR